MAFSLSFSISLSFSLFLDGEMILITVCLSHSRKRPRQYSSPCAHRGPGGPKTFIRHSRHQGVSERDRECVKTHSNAWMHACWSAWACARCFNKGLTGSLPLLFIGYVGASPISTREASAILSSLSSPPPHPRSLSPSFSPAFCTPIRSFSYRCAYPSRSDLHV